MSRSARPAARRHTVAVLGLGVLLPALLVGCSGGGPMSSESADSGGGSAGLGSAPAGRAAGAAQGYDTGSTAGATGSLTTAHRPAVQTRAVIRRGELWLVSRDVPAARARIDHVVGRYGGLVEREESSNTGQGRVARTTMVLRFPEPDFDTVMRELAKVARVQSATRDSEDVTTEVIDVDTRVATAEASLRRLQRFLRGATDIDAIIRLEQEIATRQAELESLKAQQEYLADQTALSTVTVHLSAAHRAGPPPPEDDLGFLVGLSGGWKALRGVLLTIVTIAGALLPFAVTLAILGVPVWLLVRGLTRRHRPGAAPVAAPAPASAGRTGAAPGPDAEG